MEPGIIITKNGSMMPGRRSKKIFSFAIIGCLVLAVILFITYQQKWRATQDSSNTGKGIINQIMATSSADIKSLPLDEMDQLNQRLNSEIETIRATGIPKISVVTVNSQTNNPADIPSLKEFYLLRSGENSPIYPMFFMKHDGEIVSKRKHDIASTNLRDVDSFQVSYDQFLRNGQAPDETGQKILKIENFPFLAAFSGDNETIIFNAAYFELLADFEKEWASKLLPLAFKEILNKDNRGNRLMKERS